MSVTDDIDDDYDHPRVNRGTHQRGNVKNGYSLDKKIPHAKSETRYLVRRLHAPFPSRAARSAHPALWRRGRKCDAMRCDANGSIKVEWNKDRQKTVGWIQERTSTRTRTRTRSRTKSARHHSISIPIFHSGKISPCSRSIFAT